MTLGRMQNPVRGFMHGSAALVAVAGTIVLIARASSLGSRVAVAVYGLGMVALYTTSSLYHSIPWRETWKKRMQRLDHAMIFVLIAASVTPIGAIVLDGWIRIATLGIAWFIAIVGVGHHLLIRNQRFHLSIGMMITMGWLSTLLMIPIANRAGAALVWLVGAGGIVYSVGVVIVITNRPRLWPRVFSYHELFHVFVVTASALHFTAIYRYVAPFMASPAAGVG